MIPRLKVVLAHGRYWNSWEALGLGYLASYVLENFDRMVELRFLQGCFDSDVRILSACENADIVAWSCTTPTFPHALELSRQIKSMNPGSHVVMGGYHPSADPQGCLLPGVDQVVVGEGEYALLEILQGCRDPIVYGRAMQWSELSWPHREFIQNERNIQAAFKDTGKRITSFQSHRACPFRCKYCLDGAIKVLYPNQSWNARTLVRYRDVDDLLDEMGSVTQEYRLDLAKFSDPTWNTDLPWVLKFCERKIARKIEVPFYPNLHAGVVTQQMTDAMAKANCYEVAFGIESGSPKILKQIGKGTTVESIRRGVRCAQQSGILVRGYFILGMPDETHEDLKLTEALAEELELGEYGFSILCPYPGTTMYDAKKYGDVVWEKADEYSNDFWRGEHLSNEELKEWQARLTKKFSSKLTWHNRQIEESRLPVPISPVER